MFKELIDEIGYDNILEYCENANLQNGIYIKINEDGNIEDKNIIEIENGKKDIENIELINWLKKRNCYSNYIDSNKSIVQRGKEVKTPKVITSCNCYSMFFNVSTILDNSNKNKILLKKYCEHMIIEYFDSLINNAMSDKSGLASIFKSSNVKDHMKKNKLTITQMIERFFKEEYLLIQDKNREGYINKIKEVLIKNIPNIIKKLSAIKNIEKKKVKIFIANTVENYKKEYLLYLKPKIFLSNNSNTIINNKIYGISSELFTLNNKKPLLQTNGNLIDIPCLVSIDDAIMYRNLRLYFKGNLSEVRTKGFEIIFSKDGIEKFDILPLNLKDDLELSPLIVIDYFNKNIDYIEINSKKSLENNFNYFLDGNLYSNKINNNSKVKSFVMMYKDIISNYIYKNIKSDFVYSLPKIVHHLFQANISSKKDMFNVIKCFNFKLSLLEYFKNDKQGEMIMNLAKDLKQRLNDTSNFTINNKEEFLYMCGQLGYYLNSRSKSSIENKKMSLINTYINCNNIELLKQRLQKDISKYSYDVSLNNIKFKKIIEQISSYKNENNKINISEKDYLLAGLFSNNLLYNKKKNKDNKEDNVEVI
ncbi:hypothetical protein FCV38_11870 [Clostridium sporogenes]|nr:hypothetical protein [Clostridium sporogenes]